MIRGVVYHMSGTFSRGVYKDIITNGSYVLLLNRNFLFPKSVFYVMINK